MQKYTPGGALAWRAGSGLPLMLGMCVTVSLCWWLSLLPRPEPPEPPGDPLLSSGDGASGWLCASARSSNMPYVNTLTRSLQHHRDPLLNMALNRAEHAPTQPMRACIKGFLSTPRCTACFHMHLPHQATKDHRTFTDYVWSEMKEAHPAGQWRR